MNPPRRALKPGMKLFYFARHTYLGLVVKNPHANAGDIRDMDSIPGSGRSPGRGHDNPFQYAYLENPINRVSWWAPDRSVTQSTT